MQFFFVLVVEIVQFKEVGYAIGGSVGDLEEDGGIVRLSWRTRLFYWSFEV